MAVDSELQRHRQDWEGFMRITVCVSGTIAAALILMAIFLVHTH
jgi:hypothetical protein